MPQDNSFVLSCITISKFYDSDFVQTCQSFYNSLPSGYIQSTQLVAVISACEHKDVSDFFEKHLPQLPVKIYIGMDSSLYDAMNIGIANSSGRYLFFLNAGDFVCSGKLLSDFIRHISLLRNDEFCYCFSTIQQYKNIRWLRPSHSNNSIIFRNMLPPHQGMFVPNNTLTPLFDESLPLTADSDWIRKVLSIYIPFYSLSPIVNFSLGGVSNSPCLNLLRLRLKERNLSVLILEIIKYIFSLIVTKSIYYRFIFFVRGLKIV